ncbi:MAG: acyl-CoA thioesterase [Bacteroidales bacterium]|nr:acyl-CoA thioesterase [Bacteroidales bacterium]MCF8391090.1 acyl-CoA thioesterase [Bacteroidales bacterium]
MSGYKENRSNSESEISEKSKEFSYQFNVSDDLLDEYNHVNNARYLDLYERARWDILDISSFGRDHVKKSGIGPVILEVCVKFKREIKLNQNITISTKSKIEGNRIFFFIQEMKNEEGKVCSTAIFKGALFNLKTRKIISPDNHWLKALGH